MDIELLQNENLLNEIEKRLKIEDENICKLIDVVATSSHAYFIMEYCDQGSLFKRINKHKIKDTPLKIIFQLAKGLKRLDEANLSKRNLNPRNILIQKAEKGFIYKISDFGSSLKKDQNPFLPPKQEL